MFSLTASKSKTPTRPHTSMNMREYKSKSLNSQSDGRFNRQIQELQDEVDKLQQKRNKLQKTIHLLDEAMETESGRKALLKEYENELTELAKRLNTRGKRIEEVASIVKSFRPYGVYDISQDTKIVNTIPLNTQTRSFTTQTRPNTTQTRPTTIQTRSSPLQTRINTTQSNNLTSFPECPTDRAALMAQNNQLIDIGLSQERQISILKFRVRLYHDQRFIAQLRQNLNRLEGIGADQEEDALIAKSLKKKVHQLRIYISREKERKKMLEANEYDNYEAATIIQKTWRGYFYRKSINPDIKPQEKKKKKFREQNLNIRPSSTVLANTLSLNVDMRPNSKLSQSVKSRTRPTSFSPSQGKRAKTVSLKSPNNF